MRNFRRILLPALLLLTAAASSLQALDFTLHYPANADTSKPGGKSYFLDGNSKVFVDIPLDWKVTSSPAALDALPSRASTARLASGSK